MSVTKKTYLRTMDLTPSWSAILPQLLILYIGAGTAEARELADTELRKMAKLADLYVESQKAKAG